MPAMIGIVFDGLCPPIPWHALHVSAFVAPGASSGPADAAPAASSTTSKPSTTLMIVLLALREPVIPDARSPADRVLAELHALSRRQLLLALDDFAAVDAVRVHHRNRLAVVDPAVAGIARRHLGRLLAAEQARDR